ncbi:MAG: ATP-dependent metallopeptidase FtsH/Yme1/Tma family protein, partial [Pseudomonadota bacterium]
MGNAKNLAFWAILILLLVTLFSVFQDGGRSSNGREMPFSEFLNAVDRGEVAKVTIDGEQIAGETIGGAKFSTVQPPEADVITALRAADVAIDVTPQERGGFLSTLGFWLPMLIIFGIWIYFLNRMQSGGRGAMGFGKSKAKLLTERHGRVMFDDVAGI